VGEVPYAVKDDAMALVLVRVPEILRLYNPQARRSGGCHARRGTLSERKKIRVSDTASILVGMRQNVPGIKLKSAREAMEQLDRERVISGAVAGLGAHNSEESVGSTLGRAQY